MADKTKALGKGEVDAIQSVADLLKEAIPEGTDGFSVIVELWRRMPESFDFPHGRLQVLFSGMSDADTYEFGKTSIGFGEYADRRIDDVPLSYLFWLSEKWTFYLKLWMYVNSERIQKEFREHADRRRGEYPAEGKQDEQF